MLVVGVTKGPGGQPLVERLQVQQQQKHETKAKCGGKVGRRLLIHNSASLFVLVGEHSDGWEKKPSVMGIIRKFSEK